MMDFEVSAKKRTPLLNDVAESAAVSMATVDRVLNRRKGVRRRTTEKVLKAAESLGYLSFEACEEIRQPRPPNIVFLLPAGTNPYLSQLGSKVKNLTGLGDSDSPTVRCFFIESFDAKALAKALHKHADWADGIVFLAIDHPIVRKAANVLASQGKKLVTIVSDLPDSNCLGYVGLKNISAGRTAGLLMGQFCHKRPGKIALISGSRSYRAHAERESGFLAVLSERYPELHIVGTYEGQDKSHENYQLTTTLLNDYPDLSGIYNVGGTSDAISHALEEFDRQTDTVFIGHGMTTDTYKHLQSGTMDVVIDSNVDSILMSSIELISKRHSSIDIRMDIFLMENLPY